MELKPLAFCEVHGVTQRAKQTIKNPRHARYHLRGPLHHASLQSARNDIALQFCIDISDFRSPIDGIVFGSDPNSSDILIEEPGDGEQGGNYFRINFAWKHDPHPRVQMLHCGNRGSVIVDGTTELTEGKSMMIDLGIGTRAQPIGSKDLQFHIRVRSPLNPCDVNIRYDHFVTEWHNTFVRTVREHHSGSISEDRAPKSDEENEALSNIGCIRYDPARGLVHEDDLRKALVIPLDIWDSSKMQRGLDRRNDGFMTMDHAEVMCELREGRMYQRLQAQSQNLSPTTGIMIIRPCFLGIEHEAKPKSESQIARVISDYDNKMKGFFVSLIEVDFLQKGDCTAVSLYAKHDTGRLFVYKDLPGLRTVEPSERSETSRDESPTAIEDRAESALKAAAATLELRCCQGLFHEHIIEMDWCNFDEAEPGLLMPYFAIGHLREWLPFAEKDTITIAKQILSALTYIHKLGLIHRDIKPENILVASFNPFKVKLIDFGYVRNTVEPNYGGPDRTCGTKGFIAPEVIRLKDKDKTARTITPAADIWSLGATLYECLLDNGSDDGINSGSRASQKYSFDDRFHSLSVPAQTFLRAALRDDEHSRPSAIELAEYDWLNMPLESMRSMHIS